MRYEGGRKRIYGAWKTSYSNSCELRAEGFLDETYYTLLDCDAFKLHGESTPSNRMAVKCYIRLEGDEITVFEKKPWNKDIKKYTLGKKISGPPLYL